MKHICQERKERGPSKWSGLLVLALLFVGNCRAVVAQEPTSRIFVECCSSSAQRLKILLEDPIVKQQFSDETGVDVRATGVSGLDFAGVQNNLDQLFPPDFVPPGAVVEIDGPVKNGELAGLTPQKNFDQLKDLIPAMRIHLEAEQNNILIAVNQARPSAMPDHDFTKDDDDFNTILGQNLLKLGPDVFLSQSHTCWEFPGTGITNPDYFEREGLHLQGIENYIRWVKIHKMLLDGGRCP